MTYFKINNIDFSMYVNSLLVSSEANYNLQNNAAGDSVADYINHKRRLDVGIIPLDDEAMKNLLAVIQEFNVLVSYRNPQTGELAEDINCIIPSNEVEYYTIQNNNVSYKAFTLQFIEL